MSKNKIMLILGLAALMFIGLAASMPSWGEQGKGANLYYLEVDVKEPRPVTVKTAKGEEVYWYFTYTVKNATTQKVYFCPTVHLLTEDGEDFADSIYTAAADVINKRIGKKLPVGLQATGDLAPGQSKECLAIIKGVGAKADRLFLRIGGLTNEYILKAGEKEPTPVFKVYQIEYLSPGDDVNPAIDQLTKGASSWVWENDQVK